MAILIDPPMWPAHGTLWSHLVSDTGYDELHAFARQLPVPRRGFDLDHYDVPASLHARAVELGAIPVEAKALTRRLRAAGLRVRQVDRETVTPLRRREFLLEEWRCLGKRLDVNPGDAPALCERWQDLGTALLERWGEPHRRYHDERHLEDVLLSLDHLAGRGERIADETLLAAWFHDAIYAGRSGADEAESARLAVESLTPFTESSSRLSSVFVARVGEMIVATEPAAHGETAPDDAMAHLLDADLAIFAAAAQRYDTYAAAVREEYRQVPDAAFAAARAEILTHYLSRPSIYATRAAQEIWEDRARANIAREIDALRG